MVERAPAKKRDTARLAAWGCAIVTAVGFTLAGVVYRPGAELPMLISSASFALDMQAFDFAREQIELAARRAPDDAAVNFLRGRLAWVDRDREAAKQFVDRSLASDPSLGEAHLFRAYLAYEEQDWDAALDHYQAGAVTLESTQNVAIITEYRVRVGLLLLAAGEFERAAAVAERIASDAHRPAAAEVILAFSRLGRGDDTGFGQGLARAYSIDPFDALFRQGAGPLARAFPWLPAR